MLIECVPNFSEGARADVIAAIVSKVREEPGVRVLDLQSDASHNRSVLTMAGDPASLARAALALVDVCLGAIDLRGHKGEHPRMGAVDVVPFIPLQGATIADCVALAREVGDAIARRYNIPVFLYEDAATATHRKGLEDIRRGQFEGLSTKLVDPLWKPDFGPAQPHPSFGAMVVGARMPLIAFNVNLTTDDVEIAKRIAKGIRHSTGGYRFVKAMGLIVDIGGRKVAQVSMNMTDYAKTPLFRVVETIRNEAARYGVAIIGSEIVGLVPSQALVDAAEHYLQLTGFSAQQVLENRLQSE